MEIRFFFSLWRDFKALSFGTDFIVFWFAFSLLASIMTGGVCVWEAEVDRWEVVLVVFLSLRRETMVEGFEIKYTMMLELLTFMKF